MEGIPNASTLCQVNTPIGFTWITIELQAQLGWPVEAFFG
jgi:hypothetical protein